MKYIDFINNWSGEREEYGGQDCPVLRRPGESGEVIALLHTEGVLYRYPQSNDIFDHDPDITQIVEGGYL